MRLSVKPRTHERKSEAALLRREGYIPAIVYHKDKTGAGQTVSICKDEFAAHLRSVPPGRLSTLVFTLDEGHGKGKPALVKDIQYYPIDYSIMHIDFVELDDKIPVKVKVPLVIQGEADSVGVKLGGMVRLITRSIKVQCLPKDIPTVFVVDVKNMNVGETLRVADIEMPKTVKPLVNMNTVAVSMVKK